jgi:CBS domain containing-hemolysin-like protein
MGILIAFFLLSITFSFLCSIWEAVLLSVTPSYIKTKENEGHSSGKLLAGLKHDIDTPLSAILTLNTIAHTVGAIGVGAQAGDLYGTQGINLFGWELSYETIVATAMTLAILIFSEIIPKTIGANNWKSLAPITGRSLSVLIVVLKPFVWVSKRITNLLNRGEKKSVFSRRDFAAMADVVSESGEIKTTDHTLIKNVLAFDELKAEDVMTPRPVVVMADQNQKLTDFYKNKQLLNFSRIPLYNENKDSVTGMVLKDDLLLQMVEGNGEKTLGDIKREISFVNEKLSLRKVFEELNNKHAHLSAVIDEYGGLEGLVSMEDIFETLFGLEIMDETDSVKDLRQYARKRWEERARKLGIIE